MRKHWLFIIIGACFGGVVAPIFFLIACSARLRDELYYVLFYPVELIFELTVKKLNLSSGGEILLPLYIPATIIYGVIVGAFTGWIIYWIVKIQKEFEKDINAKK